MKTKILALVLGTFLAIPCVLRAEEVEIFDPVAFAVSIALVDTLYYEITDVSNMTVKVVDHYIEDGEQYYVYPDLRGTIVIPDTVKHGGQSYCVTEIGSTAFSEKLWYN